MYGTQPRIVPPPAPPSLWVALPALHLPARPSAITHSHAQQDKPRQAKPTIRHTARSDSRNEAKPKHNNKRATSHTRTNHRSLIVVLPSLVCLSPLFGGVGEGITD